jgi:hypothetical protein
MSKTSRDSNWNSVSKVQRERYKARVKDIIDQARNAGCYFCGESDPAVLQFHHIDPETKEFDVGNSHQSQGIEKVRREIAKCIVVCGNDHLRIHAGILDVEQYNGIRKHES